MIVIENLCSSNIIVNGRKINKNICGDSVEKKYDEIKKQSANGINQITISSNVNVRVSAFNTDAISAHLHGSAMTNINLSMSKLSDEIHISAELEENSADFTNSIIISKGSVEINDFSSYSDLTLDVQIPIKTFEKIFLESKNANINVKSPVNANTISIENKNGNIDVSAVFRNLNINCKNGNIAVNSEANSDINFYILNKNGNVDVTLDNIGNSRVSVDSKNGNCKNNPNLKGTYTVSGSITSKNGNVSFH